MGMTSSDALILSFTKILRLV